MGYSICTVAKSKKLKDEMLAFMGRHYRPFWQVVGIGEITHIRGPTDDMSYCHGPLKLGVDYISGMGDLERKYSYALVYWMAIRIGRRTMKEGVELISFNYDDCPAESWPLVMEGTELPKDFPWTLAVDTDGWSWSKHECKLASLWAKLFTGKGNGMKHFNMVRSELKRLSGRWAESHQEKA